MKRIQPHFAGNVHEGWAFDVEDDSPLSDNTPLKDIARKFAQFYVGNNKAVNNGRTMMYAGPWFACRGCGDVLLEYAHKPHLSPSGGKYCGPCALKVDKELEIVRRREDMVKQQKKRRAS